jgi:uncharacterized protein (UPF0276 family)
MNDYPIYNYPKNIIELQISFQVVENAVLRTNCDLLLNFSNVYSDTTNYFTMPTMRAQRTQMICNSYD